MRTRTIVTLLLCLFFASPQTYAQQYTVRGQITDKNNALRLDHAAVTLVHLPDSILNVFTRTDSLGMFTLHPDTAGSFEVLISFPGFGDFVDVVTVKRGEPAEMGIIPMTSKINLMNEFVFRQHQGSIKISGDTTEYKADSFKVHDNATVEELLKKMPGIQVDKNGGITAQGEKVQKVLVDGEEFFSDDPAVVTKSLDAKSVDKVQVFDKKSDEATFSGIDDGQKIKTINLELKEDRRKGYFGKLQLGGGTDGYFENEGMINAFKGKRQISAFGIVANTGKMGLGWEDRDKYGGNSGGTFDEESGGMYYMMENDGENMDWSGKYNGQGLPTAWTGGVHYANKWEKMHDELSGNYRYGKQNIEKEGNTLTQYSLPGDSQYYQRQNEQSFSSGERHRVDAQFDWKPDTTSEIKATVVGGYTHTITNTYSKTDTRGLIADGLINNSDRTLNTDADNQKLNATLMYRKKLKKKGRNYSINITEGYSKGSNNSYLKATNEFYKNGTLDSTQITDQRKSGNTENFAVNGNLNYTEPLSKVAFLTVGYGLGINNSSSTKLSFNREAGGEFTDVPDSTYSNKYDFNIVSHKGLANVKFVYKKYNFSLGASVFHTIFNQGDLLHDTTYRRTFTNYSPTATFNYNFTKQKRFTLNYSGSTHQPTIEQIQPIRQNTDPLNQQIGNPDLKQEFSNNIRLSLNDYKVLSGLYYYLGGGFNFTQNDITTSQTLNDLGGSTTQYVNMNGNYTSYFWGNIGKKLNKLDMQTGLNGNANFNHMNNFVNGVKNTSNNNTYSLGIELSKDWKKKDKEVVSIEFRPTVSYNDNRATISTYTTSYWSAEINLEGSVELPWKLRVNTGVSWALRQQTELFRDHNSVVTWDAYCARKFGKANRAEVRLNVCDILNQNVGFTRNASSNYIMQNSYTTIRRYGMLNFVWNFAKRPAGMKAPEEDED